MQTIEIAKIAKGLKSFETKLPKDSKVLYIGVTVEDDQPFFIVHFLSNKDDILVNREFCFMEANETYKGIGKELVHCYSIGLGPLALHLFEIVPKKCLIV